MRQRYVIRHKKANRFVWTSSMQHFELVKAKAQATIFPSWEDAVFSIRCAVANTSDFPDAQDDILENWMIEGVDNP